MRLFLIFLVAMLVGCTTVYAEPPVSIVHVNGMTESAADLESKTVALIDPMEDGMKSVSCSGVWVGEEQILTANHCVADMALGEIQFYVTRNDMASDTVDKRLHLHAAFLVKRNEDRDLAMLRTALSPKHTIAGIATDPYVGEPVQTMGHPLGLWWTYSTGIVSGIRRIDWGDDDPDSKTVWVQTTAPVSPGNSGGGLFDARGDVLGICHGYFPRGQNLNLYVHVAHIRDFLRAS